ncbi:putative dioxygenase [Marinobacterium lacunae]|uniref:MEMO1 family protein ADIMK_1966 n=1 Tax=Marinobacterium lacunae TaxID=1232683 RepID=A0A081FZ84_9GAMM|nr:AmmeMemoRadiSam system protein B [Marinobacterium lacunae]KEA63839.1 putative dioxygenase [Marinobacterium lacunae]MBR9882545.1 AmmeMemoRadiSam system protein B [Oceanospirillales bacterium]
MNHIRPAAVAGLFYPGQADSLRRMVLQLLTDNPVEERPAGRVRALVVPHAGLIYSGPVAARAYNLIRSAGSGGRQWRTVLMLGPNHRVPLRGIAAPDVEMFDTPVGSVSVDTQALLTLERRFDIQIRPDVHENEHCLEVQLPFLRELLPGARVLPLVVGQVGAERVADLIEWAWQQPDMLVVVSSDLSHYHGYADAKRIDGETDAELLAFHHEIRPEQACGAYALNGLMLAAERKGLQIDRLDLRNSGDTAGGRDQVVGYGSYVLY